MQTGITLSTGLSSTASTFMIGSSSYVNFISGGTGYLSLQGWDQSSFDALVTAGQITLGWLDGLDQRFLLLHEWRSRPIRFDSSRAIHGDVLDGRGRNAPRLAAPPEREGVGTFDVSFQKPLRETAEAFCISFPSHAECEFAPPARDGRAGGEFDRDDGFPRAGGKRVYPTFIEVLVDPAYGKK